MNRKQLILDEQYFPYYNMTLEERNFYLKLLRNCKDICSTEQKVNNQDKCEIVEMSLRKNDENDIYAQGSLIINGEVRCIDADIFKDDKKIFVDMHVTRLCNESSKKEYRVLDIFEIQSNKLKRTSEYNYDMKKDTNELSDKEIKESLK